MVKCKPSHGVNAHLKYPAKYLVPFLKGYLNSIVPLGVANSQATGTPTTLKSKIALLLCVSLFLLLNPFYNNLLYTHTHTYTYTRTHTRPHRKFYFSACTFFGLTLYLNFIFIFMLAKAQRHKKPFLVNSLSAHSLARSRSLLATVSLALPWEFNAA